MDHHPGREREADGRLRPDEEAKRLLEMEKETRVGRVSISIFFWFFLSF